MVMLFEVFKAQTGRQDPCPARNAGHVLESEGGAGDKRSRKSKLCTDSLSGKEGGGSNPATDQHCQGRPKVRSRVRAREEV